LADEEIGVWEPEDVPDPDMLLMRAHWVFFSDGDLLPGVFRDHGSAMSTDWSKYAKPSETLARGKVPGDNAVIGFAAGNARSVGLKVCHTPDRENGNRAHTDVSGNKRAPEVRLKLLRATQILINAQAP